MISRNMEKKLIEAALGFPVITITGPRQSGKTTLARMAFPAYKYYNLENPETLYQAQSDPRSLFKKLDAGIIIDEIQKLPELLSWVQVLVDEYPGNGKVILTGSNQFEYFTGLGQTLAGRTAIFKLLPFCIDELNISSDISWESAAVKGFYPRIYNGKIDLQLFYSSYVMTYLERDIRALMRIIHLREFERFVALCAGRTGQILNINALSVECGVDHKTIQSWLSLLEASFIIYIMKPFHSNINKRLIKAPKLYFYDTGLVCYLLGIRNEKDIVNHPLKGEIFETMIIGETLKYYLNLGHTPPINYFRDAVGHEIDLVINQSNTIFPIEIKSGSTVQKMFWKNINYLRHLFNADMPAGLVIGDSRNEIQNNTSIKGWNQVSGILKEL